eukprot:jgi/Hompol1/5257/HPOL_004275-RA
MVTTFWYSRAKSRIAAQNSEIAIPFAQRKKARHEWYTYLMGFETKSLQFGDDRPMGFCCFAPNSKMLATASWSGLVKLWSVPDSEQLGVLRGHKDRVSGIAFHPRSTLDQPTTTLNLATSGSDGSVNLWSLAQDTPISKLVGHEMRVSRLAFHPSGRFIATASFDTTWRLWDAETQQELLLQDRQSREVFTIGFQTDGSLVATAGLDCVGRVWDLRTGRSIMVLTGHVKPILGLDWSPNGYQMATGGEDNTIRVWDIRAANLAYTIPAHTNIVSQVKYWHSTDVFEHPELCDEWRLPKLDGREGAAGGDHHSDGNRVGQAVKVKIEPQDDSIDPAAPNGVFDPTAVKTEDTWDEGNSMQVDTKVPLSAMATAAVRDGQSVFEKGSQSRRLLLDGSFLVSSSYDGTCKIWTDGDYKPLKALTGIESKVMCADISGDGKYIATAMYDRTFKLYANSE